MEYFRVKKKEEDTHTHTHTHTLAASKATLLGFTQRIPTNF